MRVCGERSQPENQWVWKRRTDRFDGKSAVQRAGLGSRVAVLWRLWWGRGSAGKTAEVGRMEERVVGCS